MIHRESTANTTTGSGGSQARVHSFLNQLSLKLSEHGEDIENQFAGGVLNLKTVVFFSTEETIEFL